MTDVLSQAGHWDETTRKVVLSRVSSPPDYAFFDQQEISVLEVFCDTVVGQDMEPLGVPVLRYVDSRLAERRFDGFQYAQMPRDDETWRLVARGLSDAGLATDPFGVCSAFAAGELSGGVWDQIPADLAWKVVMRYVLSAFYAHPYTWNEIGFGGPAYPRGYSRLGPGGREPWE